MLRRWFFKGILLLVTFTVLHRLMSSRFEISDDTVQIVTTQRVAPSVAECEGSAQEPLSSQRARVDRDHLFPASTLQTPGWLLASDNRRPPLDSRSPPRLWVSDVQLVLDHASSAGVLIVTQNMRFQQAPHQYDSVEQRDAMLDDPLSVISHVSVQILDAPYETAQRIRDRTKASFLASARCQLLVTGTGQQGETRRQGDISQRYCTDEIYCPFDSQVTQKLRQTQLDAYLKVLLNLNTTGVMKDYYTTVIPFNKPVSNSFFKRTRRLIEKGRKKDTISLCLTGVYHRPRYLRELMLFRLAQGYDHIYVGVENDGVESDAHQLRDLVEEGRVSVIPMEFLEGRDCHSKLPFLQSCLWHSKNFDKYTSVYDHDENLFWEDASLPLIQVVEDTVRVHDLKCQVELAHAGGSLRPWDTTTEYFGEAFPDRGQVQVKPPPGVKQDPGNSHVRTILFTQKGLHCGACGMQYGFCNQWPYDQQFNNSPREHGLLLVHEADQRSMRSEGYPEGYPKERSEYLQWFPRVKQELADRCERYKDPALCPPYAVA